ncbi:MAG: dimethylmenaquinone methyltransferase [Acidithiobacillales bacterium SM23_46]|jgi:demethylmenaquinone methyltransferase/2-methoxy-6-polyprenyl-1,4-benzoquinol methylase|nr:MAG: dimethylmenaquinone methyltransferase [Acidithiobacillales bacterium SM23_46]KPL28348.1 MAG: dimethylmenaquinone methyltransferase [Acidithiobacillales bacterium SM1_46]
MKSNHAPLATAEHAPHPVLAEYYRNEGERRRFVRDIFDHTAQHYDHVERMLAFGSGSWYRRKALERAGLAKGMDVLDVAVGTGLVAREAVRLSGDASRVIGLDPSRGMLAVAKRNVPIALVQAPGERLPMPNDRFDLLSMGFALRHASDLEVLFREYLRVLKPGGRVCVLEITRPRGRIGLAMLRFFLKGVVPTMTRLTTHEAEMAQLMRYYWDTIEACVPPEIVLQALRNAGFTDVRRHVELGTFSEYVATKPPAR